MSDPHSRPEDLPTFAAGTASGGKGLPTSSENAKTFADGAQTSAGATFTEAAAGGAAAGHVRPLPHRAPARRGRHGRGLRGRAGSAAPDGRAEGHPAGPRQPRAAAPVRARSRRSSAGCSTPASRRSTRPARPTPDGPQPYFAMEFIRGEPLREYADAQRLGVAPAARAAGPGLRRGAARAPAGRHPPRPQARQHPGRREPASRRSSTSASPASPTATPRRRCRPTSGSSSARSPT